MVGEPFLAIVNRGKIEYGSKLVESYKDGDRLMIAPKEVYDRLIDDHVEMQIKLDKIKEVLELKELYMEDIDENEEKKDKLYRIREIVENSISIF